MKRNLENLPMWKKLAIVGGGYALLVLFIATSSHFTKKNRVESLRKNPKYAIGKLTKVLYPSTKSRIFGAMNKTSVGGVIRVEFYDKEKLVDCLDRSMRPSLENRDLINVGNLYLVIYESTDVKNCYVLYDYPIKDSSDYERYLVKLEKEFPNIDPSLN